ncbi:hypothetical protein EKD04_017785 [Chloroflexales bacterium ZM16-3]|nr:hypothetical protein [Chloroflexales bacterium ZM16-3]
MDDPRITEITAALRKLYQAQELLADHMLDTPNETNACHDAIAYAQGMIIEALEGAGISSRQIQRILADAETHATGGRV